VVIWDEASKNSAVNLDQGVDLRWYPEPVVVNYKRMPVAKRAGLLPGELAQVVAQS
jgi:hypothetical protein